MPTSPLSTGRVAYYVLLACLSGALWIMAWQLNQSLLTFATLPSGISLLYLPAGVRLLIILVAGVCGATGLTLACPLALLQLLPGVSAGEMLVYSLISGFVPWAALGLTRRAAGVSANLANLRATHLPLMSATVSVTTALALSTALVLFSRFPAHRFLQIAAAVAAGDFLGCFAVVALARIVMGCFRWLRGTRAK